MLAFSFWLERFAGPLSAFALALTVPLAALPPAPASAQQEPEFGDIPFAPDQWLRGRRLNESQFRYCVDQRDPDWEVAGAIADAIAGALLLQPQRYVVESRVVLEDITRVYAIMIEHCDVHVGFKLIPGLYPNWITLTRAYYEAEYVFVTADPDIGSLADLAPSRPIGATIGTAAHIQLVNYLKALPAASRWPTYPYGTNELALESLLNGSVDVAIVWAPDLWAKQQADPAYASLRVISSSPLPPTGYGVGAILLADETFLRSAVDQAIAALSADGTIQSILDQYQFPATAPARQ
jgi:polar amino acid transport system substrate-binding protein